MKALLIHFALGPRMIRHLQNGGCLPRHGSFTPTEDLSEPPSLAATVLSRSACDWTEVSLSLLPVIALPDGATTRCCTLREAYACRCRPAVLPDSSRNVFCKGLFSFRGTGKAFGNLLAFLYFECYTGFIDFYMVKCFFSFVLFLMQRVRCEWPDRDRRSTWRPMTVER